MLIIASFLRQLVMQTSTERRSLQLNSGKLDPNDHFLQRATDALSVIKISNSYLKTTLGTKKPDTKTIAALDMIEKSVLKIEALGSNFPLFSCKLLLPVEVRITNCLRKEAIMSMFVQFK